MGAVGLQIVFAVMFLVVGFLLGMMAEGEYHDNKKVDDLERKVKRLERRLNQ